MGASIFERIQAKLELFRLEQQYTRRRHRRSTFQSNAIYVDGEYIYQTPNWTGSSSSSGPRINALHEEQPTWMPAAEPELSLKKLNRFSMPGFGSTSARPAPSQD